MKIKRIGLTDIVFALCLLLPIDEGLFASGSSDHSAEEIHKRMVDVYAKAETYQDSGVIECVTVSPEGSETTEARFTTVLSRNPGRFRFEFRDHRPDSGRYIIWAAGRTTRVWWDLRNREESADSLVSALARATGVTEGSARRIPGLLLRDRIRAGWDIRRLQELRRLDDGEVNGFRCYRIEGTTGVDFQGTITLWIDASSFLIRKIEQTSQLPIVEDTNMKTTTTYSPEINHEIPDERFEFSRPNYR